ncbi:S8 family serine peptidase [Pseudomonas kermanshahensis]|uniref:S8 family serine peptidase n=1 Tax=Pseudomonas kermanshahensis TaxID=2745482 RepID=UPI0023DB45CE|nr:S8 family serine peptidase [Pseudomonas kermanshahensis]WEL53286.1 S8 family serine peptidase [Pseudomonas kermanshahensis]
MTLDLNFVYYRNFCFDGKFHVRCIGADLHKVSRVRYELERAGPEGAVSFRGVSVQSEVHTGRLEDHGCPATLIAEEASGVYSIRPSVVLLDEYARAANRPTGAAGIIDLPPLVLEIKAEELNRRVLEKIPLPSAGGRGKREVDQGSREYEPCKQLAQGLAAVAPGAAYPTLVIEFQAGGYQRLLDDLQPESGSVLVRYWPNLITVLSPRPVLDEQEQHDDRLQALRTFCYLEQPPSMLNDTYLALLKTLAALEYVQSMQFLQASAQPNLILLGAAAAVATLLTGAAVVAGNRAHENAQPTPDFEPRQHYLDAPGPRWKGLNVRKAWAGGVTGRGSRIHFSDGGLFAEHEDLRGNPDLKIVSLAPNDDPKHGTASVGVILAARNGFGATGVSHDSELYLYHNRSKDIHGNLQVLKDLLRNVEPGDIVAINRQTANPEVLSTLLPSVHDKAWWVVMQQLTQRGAVVVNAAANGSSKTLVQYGTQANQGVYLGSWPSFNDHGDAGVILIGACQSYNGKAHPYSNYGYRYRMLNAWGDSVVTLSRGDLQDLPGENRDYSESYAGTSSATPMVTGALSLIQSYAMEHHHVYLNADQMHLLAMASGYEEDSLPGSDVLPMGARPNVHGALVMLDRILGNGRFEP